MCHSYRGTYLARTLLQVSEVGDGVNTGELVVEAFSSIAVIHV